MPELPKAADNDLFANLKDAKILLVGDLLRVGAPFGEEGYDNVTHVSSLEKLVELLQEGWKLPGQLSLVVLSTELPDGDAFELCRQLTEEEELVVVMVGEESRRDEWRALQAGAVDYVFDTSSPGLLIVRYEKALAQNYFTRQIQENSERHQKMFVNILQVMAKAIEARDPYTLHHSEDVARFSRRLATKIGWDEMGVRLIGVAGLLHDIGKIGVPEELLTKPGPLTDEEYEIFKKHPLISVVILEPIAELRDVIKVVRHHHEWYDGSGYPDGLQGENIPLGARIVHIGDAYESMLSRRVYRETPLTKEKALAELRRCAGTQFDPKLVEVFLKMETEKAELAKQAKPAKGEPKKAVKAK